MARSSPAEVKAALAFLRNNKGLSRAQFKTVNRLVAEKLQESPKSNSTVGTLLTPNLGENPMRAHELVWEYGITTVLSRINDLFPKTLNSLMNAGFDTPRIFVDGCTPSEALVGYAKFNLPLTIRDNVRTAGHWVLSLYELYIRNPAAERYAIFQDDFVTVKNLKRYLEIVPYPSQGYLNLYTFPSNQSIAPQDHTGWYVANQLGRGAVALVFSNEAVRKLLASPYMVDRFQSTVRGHKAIDGGVLETMKRYDWKEYVHTPSLVQHTGLVSSMGNPQHLQAISFPGEDFNALDLINR